MLTDVQRNLVDDLARSAAPLWTAGPAAVEHIADSGNSVWMIHDGTERTVLRLTNPAYRSRDENAAEMEFLRHLVSCGVQVAGPIASVNGHDVEEVTRGGVTLCASCFTWADGLLVTRGSEAWDEAFFHEWGRSLAAIHTVASAYEPRGAGLRWQWKEEILLAQAGSLLPADDAEVRAEFAEVMAQVDALPKDAGVYGMVHADYAPQNFRYRPGRGITAFDFGNCCYHWYASDVAISLSTLLRLPPEERDRCRDWLVRGYLTGRPGARAELDHVRLFLRLRIIYVYLSRLMKFGAAPTSDERRTLEGLRGSVLERADRDAVSGG